MACLSAWAAAEIHNTYLQTTSMQDTINMPTTTTVATQHTPFPQTTSDNLNGNGWRRVEEERPGWHVVEMDQGYDSVSQVDDLYSNGTSPAAGAEIPSPLAPPPAPPLAPPQVRVGVTHDQQLVETRLRHGLAPRRAAMQQVLKLQSSY